MKQKPNLIALNYLIATVLWAGCFIHKSYSEPDAKNWLTDSLIRAIELEQPWKGESFKPQPDTSPEQARVQIILQEFDANNDEVSALLSEASGGDALAMAKLRDFSFENPDSPLNVTIAELSASEGLVEVVDYYSLLLKSDPVPADRLMIVENTLDGLISRSQKGELIASVALYRFFGELSMRGVSGRFGDNRVRAGEFLKIVHQSLDSEEVANLIRNEKLRIGWLSQIDSEDPPHVGKNWSPVE